MHIQTSILISILSKLAKIYPCCADEQRYQQYVAEEASETIFIGHLLYLAEKGLIETDLHWDLERRQYQLNPGLLRINSYGLDLLKEQARGL
ncbi:hypothetical protein ACRFNZ_19605 [Klebsiella quasipneumoniae]|uniref:hypothetical protein n=1 Tax=Klebsiella quasipneumoniae TaxID=1463165 RepID=UPI0027E97071|nr:hypothetical protein [Klebsiella pneumoniae]